MIAYNLFIAENPKFVNRSLRLVFNMYDNNLDSWNDMCYGFSVIRCMSHIIGYILCLIMFLSCVIRMDTKSEYNSQQNVDEKTSLLNYDVDAKLIDDEEINVRCFEADKKETEVDVVDAKLIKIDNSEGQHKV
ncbi:unnamed protein product [Rhizophagus irregularis]|nr:unnamed protein product [Rhizophagus irregularis]